MRRFLMVLALVAAAGVTYVATATGGQQAGPTAKQFATLKKQVTKLQKQVKTAQIDASASLGFVVTCVRTCRSGWIRWGRRPTATCSGRPA